MKKKNNIPFKEVQSVMGNTLDELVRNAAQKMISKAIKM